MDIGGYIQAGTVTLLVSMIGWLFWKRASNQVRNTNQNADRESRFQDNLQARHDTLLARCDALAKERDKALADLQRAMARLEVVQMFADGNDNRAIELAQESGFADLSRPLRPRPKAKPAPPSSHDVFQAADPYAVPPPPRKPRKPT